VEAQKLFNSSANNLHVSIDPTMKVISLVAYTEKWKRKLWEIAFYREFKMKGGIMKGKTWDLQIGAKEAMK